MFVFQGIINKVNVSNIETTGPKQDNKERIFGISSNFKGWTAYNLNKNEYKFEIYGKTCTYKGETAERLMKTTGTGTKTVGEFYQTLQTINKKDADDFKSWIVEVTVDALRGKQASEYAGILGTEINTSTKNELFRLIKDYNDKQIAHFAHDYMPNAFI